MKYLSIFVLAVFINFTALPSIAVIFDWEIPTLNNNISEEEVKNNAEYNDLKKEVILNAIKKEYNKCDKRLRMIGQRWMLVGYL